MNDEDVGGGSGRATELRLAFDLSFASPPPVASEQVEDLLAIRLGGDAYAVRLREIAGMVAGRTVVPVPAVTRDLLGLAGIRGGVLAVFDLAAILGYPPASGFARWTIMCRSEEPMALAFSDFEGHLRIPTSSLHAEDVRGARGHIEQVASTPAGPRAIISVPLIVATIRNRSTQ